MKKILFIAVLFITFTAQAQTVVSTRSGVSVPVIGQGDTLNMLAAYKTAMATITVQLSGKVDTSNKTKLALPLYFSSLDTTIRGDTSTRSLGLTTLYKHITDSTTIMAAISAKVDSGSAFLKTITLTNTGILHNAPTYTYNSATHNYNISQTLATQTAYNAFRNGAGSGTPSFGSLDSNYWAGQFGTQVRAAQTTSGGGTTAANTIKTYTALGSTIKSQTFAAVLQATTSTVNTMTAGRTVYIALNYLEVGATITGVKFYQTTAGAYTATSNNQIALYSYSGGVLTQVAVSADNSALWTGTGNTLRTEPFTTAYVAAAGQYFVGVLYNASAATTVPAIKALAGLDQSNMTTMDFTNSAATQARGSGSSLPTSVNFTTLTADASRIWVAIY
jgi:hypothetical protein